MAFNRTYRCLGCLERTIERDFDTSHLSITCPTCGSFERFVNDDVYVQFEAYEETPPDSLDWNRLERSEKLVISERVVRTDRAIEDFSIEE